MRALAPPFHEALARSRTACSRTTGTAARSPARAGCARSRAPACALPGRGRWSRRSTRRPRVWRGTCVGIPGSGAAGRPWSGDSPGKRCFTTGLARRCPRRPGWWKASDWPRPLEPGFPIRKLSRWCCVRSVIRSWESVPRLAPCSTGSRGPNAAKMTRHTLGPSSDTWIWRALGIEAQR